jgi:hypothetical protein
MRKQTILTVSALGAADVATGKGSGDEYAGEIEVCAFVDAAAQPR